MQHPTDSARLEKEGNWGTWFPGKFVIWREIYEFGTKKYIRKVGKYCNLDGKFYHYPGKSNIFSSHVIQRVHDCVQSLDLWKQTEVIIMDFSKAFDVVPNKRLLLKLKHFGIKSNTHRWITNFLTQRHQRVIVDCVWRPIWVGLCSIRCSQGTVLSPLLFVFFINDLPGNLSSQVRLFVDDCVVYREIVNDYDAEMLQTDLDTLYNWGKKHDKYILMQTNVLILKLTMPINMYSTIVTSWRCNITGNKFL